MSKKTKQLIQLFLNTIYISTFTFGGGFVIITFMKRKFVDELHWIDEKEMLDFTAIAQSCPGAIAVNASALVGWRLAGIVGMAVAIIGTILPPMFILSVISYFYKVFATNVYIHYILKGMQAGVAAVILDVACEMIGQVWKEQKVFPFVIMGAAFIATFFFKINVVWIILALICVGVLVSCLPLKKKIEQEQKKEV